MSACCFSSPVFLSMQNNLTKTVHWYGYGEIVRGHLHYYEGSPRYFCSDSVTLGGADEQGLSLVRGVITQGNLSENMTINWSSNDYYFGLMQTMSGTGGYSDPRYSFADQPSMLKSRMFGQAAYFKGENPFVNEAVAGSQYNPMAGLYAWNTGSVTADGGGCILEPVILYHFNKVC